MESAAPQHQASPLGHGLARLRSLLSPRTHVERGVLHRKVLPIRNRTFTCDSHQVVIVAVQEVDVLALFCDDWVVNFSG